MAPLTADELQHFAEYGFLVKEGLLDPALCAAARDKLWAVASEFPRLRRDQPATWGPFTPEEDWPQVEGKELDSSLKVDWPQMSRRGYGFWMSSPEMQSDELLVDLLPRCPAVEASAEQLLGPGRFIEPDAEAALEVIESGDEVFTSGHGTRGIYCTLPRTGADAVTDKPCEAGARGGPPRGGHWDNYYVPDSPSPNCLMASCYIDDVPKGGGGLVVYPGSHRRNWAYYSELHRSGGQRPVSA